MIMGYLIQIEEEKVDTLQDHAKKILKHGRELIECIEEMAGESRLGERGGSRYGNRDDDYYPEDRRRMGERRRDDDWLDERRRMGERRRDEDWMDEDYIGERRGRSATTGRYVRR